MSLRVLALPAAVCVDGAGLPTSVPLAGRVPAGISLLQLWPARGTVPAWVGCDGTPIAPPRADTRPGCPPSLATSVTCSWRRCDFGWRGGGGFCLDCGCWPFTCCAAGAATVGVAVGVGIITAVDAANAPVVSAGNRCSGAVNTAAAVDDISAVSGVEPCCCDPARRATVRRLDHSLSGDRRRASCFWMAL